MSAKAGVIASEKTRLKFVPVSAVTMRDGFWKTRMDRNHQYGIPRLLKHLEDHGIVDSFAIVAGRKTGGRQRLCWTDSDLYKWMEGAAFDLQSREDPALKARLDGIIDDVVAAQGKDGYLNTFFSGDLFDQRFRNLGAEHELYCAGHLFQAAVAHYRATGDDKLLNCACRYADYLAGYFGSDKHQGVDGHPEVEMALVELYRASGNENYLELAEYFLSQWHFKEKQGVDGHAVRALYLCSGGADYFAETGDKAYGDAVERLWEDLVRRKMYVTGGVGSRYEGEEIGEPYELPNTRAYAETCAAIANAMFNYRMLAISGDGRFADEMERALYNGIISGVSLEGTAYFYQNPLANFRQYARREWFDCTCCPTNMVRLLASIPGYMYSVSDEGIWVHLFDNSKVKHKLADGTPFTLEQSTNYPWDGKIEITIGLNAPKEFTLFIREPKWNRARGRMHVSGGDEPGVKISEEGGRGYRGIHRVWNPGDKVTLDLDMSASLVECDPRVRENSGQVAVQRGPLIYCAESVDNPGTSIRDLVLASDALNESFQPDLLGGIVMLNGKGRTTLEDAIDPVPLYRPLAADRWAGLHETPITLIPYFAWANRGPSHMTVWMPIRK